MATTETNSLFEILANFKDYPAEVIIEKCKSAYNYCNWTKNRLAHSQDKGCDSLKIAKFKNPATRIKNYIPHPDDTLTVITTDNFYLKFSNR